MLNEDRIRLMTKLALYEQEEGREAIKSNKYTKSDYVSIKMINTAVVITIGYILAVTLYIIHTVDNFVEKIVKLDLVKIGIRFLVIYLIVFCIYMLLAYVIYSMKYIKMQEMNEEYSEELKELYLLYKKEEKYKNEAKLGGKDSYDDTFEF